MSTEQLPNRASDAGSEPRTVSRQTIYSYLVDDVMEAARDLDRCYVDDRTKEQRARLEIIAHLQDALAKLREVV